MPETQAVPTRKRKPFKRINDQEGKRIAELRKDKELTVGQIAAITGRSQSSIWNYLERVTPENQTLQTFKGREADTLSYAKSLSRGVRIRLLETLAGKSDSQIDELEIDKIGALNQRLAIAEGIDTEKERLIRGLSTSNVAYADMSQKESEIESEIRKLEESLTRPQDTAQDAQFESVPSETGA